MSRWSSLVRRSTAFDSAGAAREGGPGGSTRDGVVVLLAAALVFGCLAWLTANELHAANSSVGSGQSTDSAARADAHVVALRRACDFLWSKQAEDGGWHSETYGLARSGQSYTPFILHTLLDVPPSVARRPAGGVERALAFIRRHTNAHGAIGLADAEAPDYPNYATAYALRCLVRAGAAQDRALIATMRAYLVAQQFSPANGVGEESPAFGGWGFGGRRPAGSTGHMDIAHTRRALEAVREVGCGDRAVFARAQAFLRFMQRHEKDGRPQPPYEQAATGRPPYDGGFYFSPVVFDANKGRIEPARDGRRAYYRSYATATCDGVLALLAAGVSHDDERIVAARRWLEQHPRLDYPQGIPIEQPEPWGAAVHFYHFAVRAETYAALDWPGDWRSEIARHLAPQQNADGSFRNNVTHLMKEDDPLLCTALAVTALERSK